MRKRFVIVGSGSVTAGAGEWDEVSKTSTAGVLLLSGTTPAVAGCSKPAGGRVATLSDTSFVVVETPRPLWFLTRVGGGTMRSNASGHTHKPAAPAAAHVQPTTSSTPNKL